MGMWTFFSLSSVSDMKTAGWDRAQDLLVGFGLIVSVPGDFVCQLDTSYIVIIGMSLC